MGDRFYLSLVCPYCGKEEDEVWYAPTCGDCDTNTCPSCKKQYFITSSFQAKKLEEATEEEIVDGFYNASNACHSEESVKEMAKEKLQRWKSDAHM